MQADCLRWLVLYLILDFKSWAGLFCKREYDYFIKGIYNKNLNKLKYPKNFRKSIYDAEPEAIVYDKSEIDYFDEKTRAKLLQFGNGKRSMNGYLCYRAILSKSGVLNFYAAYEIINEINNKNNINYDLQLTDDIIAENFRIRYDPTGCIAYYSLNAAEYQYEC